MRDNEKNIPKIKIENSSLFPKPKLNAKMSASEHMVFSLQSLVRNEYFNMIDGNWASELLETLKNVSAMTKNEVVSRKERIYRFHSISGAKLPCVLPSNIRQEDMYQLRIAKSKGGIHGVLSENVFYIIFLDPLHNVYPDKRFGGLRKIDPIRLCCIDNQEELIQQLQNDNNLLKKENAEYLELLDKATKPSIQTGLGTDLK